MSKAANACPYTYAAGLIKARIQELDSCIKDELTATRPMREVVKGWQSERALAMKHLATVEAVSA